MSRMFEYINPLTSPYEAFIENIKEDFFPIQMHWHYFVEMIYVLSGSIIVDVNNQTFTVFPNSLVIFHSKSLHGIYPNGQEYASYAVIKFDDHILTSSNSYLPKLQYLLSLAAEDPDSRFFFPEDSIRCYPIRELVLEIVEEVSRKSYGYDLLVTANLHKIFAYLTRIWSQEGLNLSKSVSAGRNRQSFDDITEYIDAHFYEDLQVKTLARLCNMAHSTFSKAFKERYGKTCKEYINYIRVNAAQNMLLFTEHDISYISQEVGYTDSSYFIRCYKKIKGVSPLQHRKQLLHITPTQDSPEKTAEDAP